MPGPRSQLSQQRRAKAFADIETSPFLLEIIEKLEAGDSFDSVGKWLVEEKNAFDKQPRSLAKQLNRWWTEREGQARAYLEAQRANTIEEIEKLEELYSKQLKRLEIAMQNEETIGTLLPYVQKEFSEARAILHLLIDKKQSLGLYQKAAETPQSITQINNVTHVHNNQKSVTLEVSGASERAQKTLQDPKSRRKILAVVDALGRPKRSDEEAFKRRFHVGSRRHDAEGEVIEMEAEDGPAGP